MIKDIKIKVENETRKVFPDTDYAGVSYENLQGNIIFYFADEFINGVAWLEIETPDGEKGYIAMEKVNDTYLLPIKSSLLKYSCINLQLRITEDETAQGIPVFKSKKFYLKIMEAINATEEIPDEYPSWIDIANAKILEIENLDVTGERVDNGVEITFTDKKGKQTITTIYDGEKGAKGEKGDTGNSGVYLGPEEPIDPEVNVWVDSDGEPDAIDYNTAENKPKINGHELIGDKSNADLGIPTKTSDLENDSNFAKSTEVDTKIANAIKPASQTILGVAKMWTTTNSDGEVTLNISTEA